MRILDLICLAVWVVCGIYNLTLPGDSVPKASYCVAWLALVLYAVMRLVETGR